MDYKIWLIENFCPKDQYTCLMPVQYQGVEESGIVNKYRKDKMVCRHALEKNCSFEEECPFFKKAPDELDKNVPWH